MHRLISIGVLLLTACAPRGALPPAVPAANAGAPGPTSDRFPDSPGQRVRSRSLDFPIELSLPNKPSWRIKDGPIWLEAEHADTPSLFEFRTWRADRLVRRADCVAQARLSRASLPTVREESVIERRAFPAPAGMEAELVLGVEPSGSGVAGYALVFGSSVGRCYAAAFTTHVEGPGADQAVAARLAVAVDQVLAHVRLRNVDERAVRRRLVTGPE